MTLYTLADKISVEQRKFAETSFVRDYSSWTSDVYDEEDWSKVHELAVRDILTEREKLAKIAQNARCLDCPDLVKHVSNYLIVMLLWTLFALLMSFPINSSKCNMTNG